MKNRVPWPAQALTRLGQCFRVDAISLPSTESVRGDTSSGRFVDPSGRSETQETPADVGLAFLTGLGAPLGFVVSGAGLPMFSLSIAFPLFEFSLPRFAVVTLITPIGRNSKQNLLSD